MVRDKDGVSAALLICELAAALKASGRTLLDLLDEAQPSLLVIEDGPTITHGGMAHGAGWRAASDAGALIVDPRRWAGPELQETYRRYPHIGPVLPALGYYAAQIEALRDCIDACDADAVVSGTPIDLAALLRVNKPVLRARYEFADVQSPLIADEVGRAALYCQHRHAIGQFIAFHSDMPVDVHYLHPVVQSLMQGKYFLDKLQILDLANWLLPSLLFPARGPLSDALNRILGITENRDRFSLFGLFPGDDQSLMKGVQLGRVVGSARIVQAVPKF